MAMTEPASEAQRGFIESLLRERNTDLLAEEQRSFLERFSPQATPLNKGQASRIITALQELPRAERQKIAASSLWPNVMTGRYAVEDPVDSVLKFYKVDRPEEGRWAGYVFLNVQASDELYPIKDRDRKAGIMAEIEKDPKAAMLRYGQEIGACGHCGRTLTNEESRARGIGPICARRMDW